MRRIAAAAVLLLAFTSTAAAQHAPERSCDDALDRMLLGSTPDFGHDCDALLVAAVARRVRDSATVADSASLDRLIGAATWFRHPELFRAALEVARDRRASWRARAFGLQLASGQTEPYPVVLVRDPPPLLPPTCGQDPEGRPVCTVSSGPEDCLVIISKRAGFAVDRPISARLRRDFWSLVNALAGDARSPAGLRRFARCMRQFTPSLPFEATGGTPGGDERRNGDSIPVLSSVRAAARGRGR
ncbi:hypothetical protein SAMN05216486_10338 [bacterium JGI 053]|nr:hypothetical protein SAMN05216486_10338 [bacterium JGI 053]